MTVLSRGARVRRGGRRPGWVLLTTLLVLAIGASSALVFTNRVELLKLAVILALWAAVAGAFVSVLYRRQADTEQARARDLKLVYDLQLDREISARREYELTVESQLRSELAVELRAAAADEVAALRAELAALRTSLEILFDADLDNRPALETVDQEARTARALADRVHHGQSPDADWMSIDRVTMARQGEAGNRANEAIIDVPEVGVLPTAEPVLQPAVSRRPLLTPQQPTHAERDSSPGGQQQYEAPPAQTLRYAHGQRAPLPEPEQRSWQPAAAGGQWLPPGAPGGHWSAEEPILAAPAQPAGRRRRSRHTSPADDGGDMTLGPVEMPREYGGRRSRARHSAEYREHGVGSLGAGQTPVDPSRDQTPVSSAPAGPPAPRLATPPPPEPAARHRSPESEPDRPAGAHGSDTQTGGQSVADLLARLQVEPSGGGRRRRRGG
ncbi:hypothetical protein F0Q45_18135 [Mycobacterium simiae]|uniref:DUF6779 domain-containing protein n=1 Tax=Mycobacterium simiae TaxID=1784 RepID=A0A5B1BJN4_MYCSI|nr:DUF6779 domain-containing protein [Mycobacterium simiae]KAA1248887.1 hypothetical protein F0Q45_18135 [Mycobacterium simiae]